LERATPFVARDAMFARKEKKRRGWPEWPNLEKKKIKPVAGLEPAIITAGRLHLNQLGHTG
jgi:hypothetical protein